MKSYLSPLTTLQGFGRYPQQQGYIYTPLSTRECQDHLPNLTMPCITQGMGRSYGDSALAEHVINTQQLDALLAFNPATGQLRCNAGVTLAELLSVFVPKGWFLPITPGTQFVTVGGAIASDVHGKNHHHDGCFSECVASLEVLLADGDTLTCSRSQHAELFHSTCGGMGLTGIILTATLHLKPIQSTAIMQTTLKARHLTEALDLFASQDQATYSVAWIDCLAQGKSLGRSLLMLGEHESGGTLHTVKSSNVSVPFDMPHLLLNRYSIRAFNTLYYARIRGQSVQQRVHYQPFFYPLDRIQHWNRLYGRNGFVQYQLVLPQDAGKEGLHTILRHIAASGRGSFLAVLKALGAENNNLLSFPLKGYTLALDFKLTPDLLPFLDELDARVLDFHGRIYLAKDARMKASVFKRSYPRWEMFQAIRAQYGSLGRFASLQSRRLGLD
ncbi:MAG: hypothetical protein RL122_565 [Pseudomonadota bacterium]|jgi:FAD/FMN-containing dehydrogenase|nr:FAD-binding oxidoreductase [Thiothrix fructosivorans]